MEAHLSNHHRDTLEKIFEHRSSHNIEWREALSLLGSVGSVAHEHNGKLKITIGPETETFPEPHGKDVGTQNLTDLRRMLKQAGFAPDGSPASTGLGSRDHGDGQRGEPA